MCHVEHPGHSCELDVLLTAVNQMPASHQLPNQLLNHQASLLAYLIVEVILDER